MRLDDLQSQLDDATKAETIEKRELWNPPFCGEIDLHIKQDGSWWYIGTPIMRRSLVKLFASVLRKEEQDYFLVTPAEKVKIKVDDSPFIVTQWKYIDKTLQLTTNLDEAVLVGANHKIALFEYQSTLLPYANIRQNLWARFHQNVYYQLIEQAAISTTEQGDTLSLNSDNDTFVLGSIHT